jgi:GMP synthase-like glutamine amidotransferase
LASQPSFFIFFSFQEQKFDQALSSQIEFGNKRDHESSMLDHNDPSAKELVITKTVGDSTADTCRTLRFVMLGCEPSPPYGPNQHTAELLLDLIGQAASESTSSNTSSRRTPVTEQKDICWTITIRVYDVQKGEYPVDTNEWNSYDGILIPGSFASAYDESPSVAWIGTLKNVIQQEIVALQRSTLGICFGHQILAHSFATGSAVKTPTGTRTGRYTMPLTRIGSDLLDYENKGNNNNNANSFGLYYTHGDMVGQLPSVAVSLGGNEEVPIQAAAYFATPKDAAKIVHASEHDQERPKPYAVSFQAHPEYATTRERKLGTQGTLELSLDKMENRGELDREGRLSLGRDVQEHFEAVQRDSVHIMLSTGRLLGWFP